MYGNKLEPSTEQRIGPRVYAFLGRLIFAAYGRDPKPGPSKLVTGVAVYSGSGGDLGFAGFIAIALDQARCA